MKNLIILFALSISSLGNAQNLPQAVTNSFDKLFPNQVISSWTDNGYYDYSADWNDNAYFGDYNFDGYPDNMTNPYPHNYNRPYPYNNIENPHYKYNAFNSPFYNYNNSGINSTYYNYNNYNGYEYNIPPDYVAPVYTKPTQYQLDFNYNGVSMSAIFKPNGTFIIAKGYVRNLPAAVHNTIFDKFKGQTFMIAHNQEEMITPEYTKNNPVYRVKVKIKHGKSHILKIDSQGTIISDN